MTARTTYESTVKSVGPTQLAAVTAAVAASQTTIDAANSVVGYTVANGNYGNLAAAIKTANAAKAAALDASERSKQSAIALARDTLRNAGGDSAAF